MKDKKTLKQDYKNTPRTLGVFLIRNTVNDKVFLVAAIDLAGGLNRHKFALNAGGHVNRTLQHDWTELGAGKFEFEIVEELQPPNDPSFNPRRELDFMETMWLEKLEPYGDRGYNERKLTSEERLRKMAANRRSSEG